MDIVFYLKTRLIACMIKYQYQYSVYRTTRFPIPGNTLIYKDNSFVFLQKLPYQTQALFYKNWWIESRINELRDILDTQIINSNYRAINLDTQDI